MNQDTSSSAEKESLEVRKRVLKAVLAPAILAVLSEMTMSSATNLIAVFKKRYGIQLSPGTVYPVLYALEKENEIKKLPHRIRNLYVITKKGKKTIEDLNGNWKSAKYGLQVDSELGIYLKNQRLDLLDGEDNQLMTEYTAFKVYY